MPDLTKPVIFLAFANDSSGNPKYLRDLAKEELEIRKSLADVEKRGLCESKGVVGETTANAIFDVFQDLDYRNRTTIFHFGGHANKYQIFLKSAEGKVKATASDRLIPFLKNQKSIKLLFLNGCATAEQAAKILKDTTISIIIATSMAIEDETATLFSSRFYKGLLGGATVQEAFDEAVAAVQDHKDTFLNCYDNRDLNWSEKETRKEWPWELYEKEKGVSAKWRFIRQTSFDETIKDIPPDSPPPTLPRLQDAVVMTYISLELLEKLVRFLSKGISEYSKIRQIAILSGFEESKLDLVGDAESRWFHLLNKARNLQDETIIQNIVANACEMNPQNKYLIEAKQLIEQSKKKRRKPTNDDFSQLKKKDPLKGLLLKDKIEELLPLWQYYALKEVKEEVKRKLLHGERVNPGLKEYVVANCEDQKISSKNLDKFINSTNEFFRTIEEESPHLKLKRYWFYEENKPGIKLKKKYQEEIEFLGLEELLNQLLDLDNYIKRLLKLWDEEIENYALNQKSLSEIFIEPPWELEENKQQIVLSEYLDQWLNSTQPEDYPSQIALLGEYGMGKSVYMLRYACILAKKWSKDKSQPIPILISLSDNSPRTDKKTGVIARFYSKHKIRETNYETLDTLAKYRKVVYLLDGFDEMDMLGSADIRAAHFEAIWELLYYGTKMIIAGRPHYFFTNRELVNVLRCSNEEIGLFCRRVNLKPFEKEHLTEAFQKLGIKRSEIEGLLELFKNHKSVKEILQRPVLLYIAFRDMIGQQISVDVAEKLKMNNLVKRYAKYWITQARSQLTVEDIDVFMTHLAGVMLKEKAVSRIVHYKDAEALIREIFPKHKNEDNDTIQGINRDLCTCTFLEWNDFQGNYHFTHKVFFDYYAAKCLYLELNVFNQQQTEEYKYFAKELKDYTKKIVEQKSIIEENRIPYDIIAMMCDNFSEVENSIYKLNVSNTRITIFNKIQILLYLKINVKKIEEEIQKNILQQNHQKGISPSPDQDKKPAELLGYKLREFNLEEANLGNIDLAEADLSQLNLKETNLSLANLSKSDLSNSDLRGADLDKTILRETNLSKTNLEGIKNLTIEQFISCKNTGYSKGLTREFLLKAKEKYVEAIRNSEQNKVSLIGANLRETDLSKVNLNRADLRDADLGNANLEKAKLDEANLDGARDVTIEQIMKCKSIENIKGLSEKLLSKINDQSEKANSNFMNWWREAPPNWPVELWKECNEEDYIDFTKASWIKLSALEQNKLANDYQKWFAKRNGEYVEKTFSVAGTEIEMVLIPPGKYWQGSPDTEEERNENEKQREVLISKAFWCGKYAVTQKQWEGAMKNNPSAFKGENNPVETVSWDDCQEYLGKLNGKEEKTYDEMKLFNLLTEGQWEYACRSGTTRPFHFGENITTELVNYNGEYPYKKRKKGEYRKRTVEVGSFGSNGFGLYEMHGNVWEWCFDTYKESYEGDAINPVNIDSGSVRVIRGGSWSNFAESCRSANRDWSVPGGRLDFLGFRLSRYYP